MTETEFKKELYEKQDVTLSVEATEYVGDKQPLFMRSLRAEGTTENGKKIEVAINELGYGIIVTVDGRTFVLSEFNLVDAALNHIENG